MEDNKEECLDREKGKIKVKPLPIEDEYCQEVIDLEQALAKEQAEHAETLKRGNEVDDFYERLEKENELLRKLLKSLL